MTLDEIVLLSNHQLHLIESELNLPTATLQKYKMWNRPIPKQYLDAIRSYKNVNNSTQQSLDFG